MQYTLNNKTMMMEHQSPKSSFVPQNLLMASPVNMQVSPMMVPTPIMPQVPNFNLLQPLALASTTPMQFRSTVQAPVNSSFYIYDQLANTLQVMPQTSLRVNNGYVMALPGHSFVSYDIFQTLHTGCQLEDADGVLDNESVSSGRSRSASPERVPESLPLTDSDSSRIRKYPHRSKQIRIEQVHADLLNRYESKGLYARDDEVLRGEDTVRVHVKTFAGLNKIENALADVEADANVAINKIACPISMKNKFQKKGFIVYLKLANKSQVPFVQETFARYKEYFKKCDVALPKEDPKAEPKVMHEKPYLVFNEEPIDFDPLTLLPPALTKNTSSASLAA